MKGAAARRAIYWLIGSVFDGKYILLIRLLQRVSSVWWVFMILNEVNNQNSNHIQYHAEVVMFLL
jgi:hypothetical protein